MKEKYKPKGRPVGSKSKPGYKTSHMGAKLASHPAYRFTNDSILQYKYDILKMIYEEDVYTIAAACDILKLRTGADVSPTRVHYWAKNDPDFASAIQSAKESLGDKLEVELAEHANFIPKMMILKGIRPEYRDNYKFNFEDSKTKELLEELRKLGRRETKVIVEEKPIEGAALPEAYINAEFKEVPAQTSAVEDNALQES